MKLIKSYFNLYNPKEENLRSKPLRLRFKRLSVKKIFVSRAELKHTSSKVLITLYVYNAQKRFLSKKLLSLGKILFPKIYGNKELNDFSEKKLKRIEYNKLVSLRTKFIDIDLKNLSLMHQVEIEKELIVGNSVVQSKALPAMPNQDTIKINVHNNHIYSVLIKKLLEEELILMNYYKHLLDFNKAKFEDSFLLKLANIVSKIYNKKVEFNIVSLKHLHLNSDLLMQIIATKLKNRDNKLLRVLRKSLGLFVLPDTQSHTVNSATEQLLDNKIQSVKINSLFSNTIGAQACITPLLSNAKSEEDIDNIALNSIRDKAIGGIRLEVKGRLTRRFTASRSVFKIK
jgi:hypothetical protein